MKNYVKTTWPKDSFSVNFNSLVERTAFIKLLDDLGVPMIHFIHEDMESNPHNMYMADNGNSYTHDDGGRVYPLQWCGQAQEILRGYGPVEISPTEFLMKFIDAEQLLMKRLEDIHNVKIREAGIYNSLGKHLLSYAAINDLRKIMA